MTVSGLTASTTYYFGLETADEVPNWSAISNSPSGTTSAAASNLLTDGDFQSGTAFSSATYTAGTSSDGVWLMSGNWTKTANAGPGGTGDTAATVTNNWSDLRLYQGIAAPANNTQLTLSFAYIRPSGYTSTIQVLGMTNGQYIQNWAGGAVQGTVLYTYTLGTATSWTNVTNQTFTVNGTFTHLAVYVTVGGDAGDKLDNVVLHQ